MHKNLKVTPANQKFYHDRKINLTALRNGDPVGVMDPKRNLESPYLKEMCNAPGSYVVQTPDD